MWWTPSHPFKSSFTGRTCQEIADAFTADTGKQWTLLKTIAGVHRPQSGRVLFDGESVDPVSAHHRVGMGSIWGALLGGVILGIAQTLGSQAFGVAWGTLVGHLVFLAVLAFKPSGFFAQTVTT